MEKSHIDIPAFSPHERRIIHKILDALRATGDDQLELEHAIESQADQLKDIGALISHYPSLFKRQKLGHRQRDLSSLIQTISKATLFTVDMILPMRAIAGQTYLMSRINFFRLLRYVANEALSDRDDFSAIDRDIEALIGENIYAKVTEDLLIAIVCDSELELTISQKGTKALIHIWEDRSALHLQEFFPLLKATWEARRKIMVQFGTLTGTAEIFSLLREGCDPHFIEYFSKTDCTEDETNAFREFLLGVSTEDLGALKDKMRTVNRKAIGVEDIEELSDLSLHAHESADFATQFYMFFVKRHLEALARRVGNLPGPKRTAEEYVMVYFLEKSDPEEFPA